jgi:hypothetical protein
LPDAGKGFDWITIKPFFLPRIGLFIHPNGITMKVYTYFAEHATAKGGQVIELWKRSWQRAGFDPRVLRRADAEKHPRYQAVLNRVRKLPSANSQWYEVACYLRWLGSVPKLLFSELA